MPIRTTEYVIKFDPLMAGWISFYVVKETEGHKTRIADRRILTSAKTTPALAARALARVLKLKGTPPNAEN